MEAMDLNMGLTGLLPAVVTALGITRAISSTGPVPEGLRQTMAELREMYVVAQQVQIILDEIKKGLSRHGPMKAPIDRGMLMDAVSGYISTYTGLEKFAHDVEGTSGTPGTLPKEQEVSTLLSQLKHTLSILPTYVPYTPWCDIC